MMRCLKGRRSSFGQANLGTPPAGVGSNAFHVLFLKFMKPLITTSFDSNLLIGIYPLYYV